MLFVLPSLSASSVDASHIIGFDMMCLILNSTFQAASAQQYVDFYPSCQDRQVPEVTGWELGGAAACQDVTQFPTQMELLVLKLHNRTNGAGNQDINFTFYGDGWRGKFTQGSDTELRLNERVILMRYPPDEDHPLGHWTGTYPEKITGYKATPLTPADIEASPNVAIFSKQRLQKAEAGNNIYLMIVVCFLLLVMSLAFSVTANTLVVGPIENMVKQIADMMDDPLGMNKQDSAAHGDADISLTFGQKYFQWTGLKCTQAPDLDHPGHVQRKQQYETALLIATVNKIQKLLRVGFGSAGGEIVAKNLRNAKEGGGKMKVASKFGLRVFGIWGFCIIEDFNDILVALDEDIMKFVNQIALMVHREVASASGSVNKNIGEAFLLTWKTQPTGDELDYVLGEGEAGIDPNTGMAYIDQDTQKYYQEKVMSPDGLPGLLKQANGTTAQKKNAADLALEACLKIAEAVDTQIERDLDHLNTQSGQSILSVLRDKIDAHFRVHMGVGLNYGWAIEGAIGSEHKVDASYLSPNVNTAARLETANHQFGTKMLISQIVVDMMSPEAQAKLRCVDCVRPKGVAIGINIYTCDYIKQLTNPFAEGEARWQMDFPKAATPEFQSTYKEAFEHYFYGRWSEAISLFNTCAEMAPDDVSTGVLLDYMHNLGDTPPNAHPVFKTWIPEKGAVGSGRMLTAK